MNEMELDCRGLPCPQPVLRTKELLEGDRVAFVSVLVDNSAAKENVSRFLARMGYEVRTSEQEASFVVTAERKEKEATVCEVTEPLSSPEHEHKIAVLVGTDRMGKGDDVLGGKLLFNFLATLKELGPELWRLIFLNAGVKSAVEGSDALPALRDLEGAGVHILVCGTCLTHFGLLEQKRVGETTNMLDIVTALQLADKVISVM